MDYKLLGSRIRKKRLQLKLTQEKLAEIIGISNSYMGQIERGERILSLETLIKLANALGVTVDFLLQDSIDLQNDVYINQFAQYIYGRSPKQKQMALDIIRTMFLHLD
ncbi:helix-turn-helix domain-containing protein [Aneurinibacillus aneurinilyticus]|uniref:helix-turn-helix domain-containing protein n=1 Tax=Aneurinibacillus aneurinilyticus TaxID=1391 RepID=UPI0023F72CCD|nr:helix-turn-helix transcriptional regulator [Aneurinibacillus aneurinilyticus]MCI1693400.1 helix-turn-helix domain-containing protein [Aneurinibacillus aneurinilyticus]